MTWLHHNKDAILAGVVSSTIVLLLQSAVGVFSLLVYDLIMRRIPTKKIWGIKKPSQIYIVSGSIGTMTSPTGLAYLAAPDAEAVAVVSVALRILYPKAILVHEYSPNFSVDMYANHIVSIGGPINNACSRTLMQIITPSIHFDELDLVTPGSRYSVTAAAPPNNQISTDYGLIISAPNPFSPKARCIIIAGCDTHGVLAAANSLSPDPQQRRFRRAVARAHGPIAHLFRRYKFFSVVTAQALSNAVGPASVQEVVTL